MTRRSLDRPASYGPKPGRVDGITRSSRQVDLPPGARIIPIPSNHGDLQAGIVQSELQPLPGDTLRYRTWHADMVEVTAVVTWSYATVDGWLCGWVIIERLVVV